MANNQPIHAADDAAKGVSAAAIIPQGTVPLGFGCGQLYARHRQDAVRLLEHALDCGITYFDTARLYGHGQAEGLLGELMPQHRSRVILASKAGILPTQESVSHKLHAKAVKLVHKGLPPLKNIIPAPAPVKPQFGVFGVADLRRSVETSLRELKTDYLDILLLHECNASHAADPQVQEFLAALRNEGKIRSWGIATSVETTLAVAVMKNGPKPPVLQFAYNLWNQSGQALLEDEKRLTITHSALGNPFRELANTLNSNPPMAEAWSNRLGFNVADPSALACHILGHALQANSRGVVLFSTSKPEHLRSALKARDVTSAQCTALEALLAGSE